MSSELGTRGVQQGGADVGLHAAADLQPALALEIRDGIAIVTLDLPGEPVNKFTRSVKDEFIALFERLERDSGIRAAVLVSGKSDTFIAGADIAEFLAWRTPNEAERASREGHALLDRLERMRAPVVAAIHGACLGGGLEAALACAYRIATDHAKTVLGLPEVQLGLIPGAGGTQRLPRTVGLRHALDMTLTGRNVRARKALEIGLVHEVVHPAILLDIALKRARALADGKLPRNPPAGRAGAAALLLDANPLGRAVVLRQVRRRTLAKTKGNYPAPLAAIDAIAASYSLGRERGFEREARSFGQLALGSVARELIFLFFATTSLKKEAAVPEPAPEPLAVHKLGVLGAGFMGSGIAALAVQQGTLVRLKDADHAGVGKGLAAVRAILKDRVSKKQITRQQFADFLSLCGGTVDYSGFAGADLVIEAVYEDLQVKQHVLRECEAFLPGHAVFASNTSTIPIARIAEASTRPERVLGMHFFSPVPRMPLVEVIVAPRTGSEAVTTAVHYARALGKTAIVVNDAPGFYVNRILTPYIVEAGRLLDSGAPIDAVDEALVRFGFPVGPITLLDEVGLDIAAKSGAVFYDAFGDRFAPAYSLRRVIEAGRLGRKGKSGFYRYDASGAKQGVDPDVYRLFSSGVVRPDVSHAEIQLRCVLALVNEAVRCLEEGIVQSPRDGDVGAVLGIGFPPLRGGPFRYVDALGADRIVRELEELHGRFAPRFSPAELLVTMARRGDRFYAAP
ncbi:MAG: fatty acid oxidation complex subunit alpha FadJ [Gemmatimonadaceae bacterium]